MLNPVLKDYDGLIREREVTVYPKDPLQRVQDYTKNISESIFSPGVIVQEKKFLGRQSQITKLRDNIRQGKNQVNKSNLQRIPQKDNERRTASANPTMRSQISGIANRIKEENLRKQKLAAEIEELRSNISIQRKTLNM